MEPRVHPGEIVLINTLAYRFGPVQRGDVVAFEHESPTQESYLKRIVGLPGEHISIDRGNVRVNGQVLDERYVRYRDRRSVSSVTVPADGLYVLGDNRPNSDDSRDWGILPRRAVIGRAVVAVWPPKALGAL